MTDAEKILEKLKNSDLFEGGERLIQAMRVLVERLEVIREKADHEWKEENYLTIIKGYEREARFALSQAAKILGGE